MNQVYLIRNTENGKVYVGQTTAPLEERWHWHRCYAPNKEMFNDICDYGTEAFTMETLCVCPSFAATDTAEKFFIHLLGCLKPSLGYNKHKGGTHRKYQDAGDPERLELIQLKAKNKQNFRRWMDIDLFRLPDHERLAYERVLIKHGYLEK